MIASQTSIDIIKIFLIKKSKIVKQDSNISQGHYHGIYVNPTLEESECDVAIMHVGINDLLNCEGDIDQINNIL